MLTQKYKKKQEFIKAEIQEFMKLDMGLLSGMKDDKELDINLESLPSVGHSRPKKSIDLGTNNARKLQDEIKLRKKALRDVARVQATSKIGLSKIVTSLERKVLEDEKKIEILNHKLKQAADEKAMFKQKYQTLKAKVKSTETDDIKFIKTISLETREMNKSPFANSRNPLEMERRGIFKTNVNFSNNTQKLTSLHQARKERKKGGGHTAREFRTTRGDISGEIGKQCFTHTLFRSQEHNSYSENEEGNSNSNQDSHHSAAENVRVLLCLTIDV